MKKVMRILLSLSFIVSSNWIWAQENAEEDAGVGIETSIDLTSKYVWRGFDLNHKKPTIQPSVTYSPGFVKGLSLNVWSWIGVGTDKAKGDENTTIDEVDFTLSYEYEFIPEKLTGSAALITYNYLSDFASTSGYNDNDIELNAALYYTVNQYFVPYLSYYRGLDKGEKKEIAANYIEIGAAGAYIFNEQWSIAPSISTAYSDQYTLYVKKGLNHVTLSVPVTYATGAFSVTPYVNVVKPLRDLNGDKKKLIPWGGINCTYGF